MTYKFIEFNWHTNKCLSNITLVNVGFPGEYGISQDSIWVTVCMEHKVTLASSAIESPGDERWNSHWNIVFHRNLSWGWNLSIQILHYLTRLLYEN